METDNKKLPLGYAMKVKELQRLDTVVSRLQEKVISADENRAKLTEAINLLKQVSPMEYQQELILMEQDIKWMYLMLDSAKSTCRNIEKHIAKIIITKRMIHADKSAKAQEETINKTFSKE